MHWPQIFYPVQLAQLSILQGSAHLALSALKTNPVAQAAHAVDEMHKVQLVILQIASHLQEIIVWGLQPEELEELEELVQLVPSIVVITSILLKPAAHVSQVLLTEQTLQFVILEAHEG